MSGETREAAPTDDLCLNCSRYPGVIVAPITAAFNRVGSILLCEDCFIETAVNGGTLAVGIPGITSGFWSAKALRWHRKYVADLEAERYD